MPTVAARTRLPRGRGCRADAVAFRGLGTALGPVVARSWAPDQRLWPGLILASLVSSGIAYAAVGIVPWSLAVAGLVFVAHVFGGTQWVLSTVLLQQRTEDRYRGRVFATEWLLLMLMQTVSILVASAILESSLLDLRATLLAFSALQVAAGLIWGALVLRPQRSRAEGAAG